MPRRSRQLPTVQLALFRSSSPQSLDWLCLSADVREKETCLIARMVWRVNHHPKITPRYQLKFPPPCVLFEQAASATMAKPQAGRASRHEHRIKSPGAPKFEAAAVWREDET